MTINPVFPYFLFGIYIIELGKLFKDKFANFKILPNGQDLTAQVFFGTPRAAFRHYTKKNGMIVMPMINYWIVDVERKPEFEPAYVMLYDKASYDSTSGNTQIMRAPGVFNITYNVNIWNNNQRERDYMFHAIYNTFPKGEAHLIYFPDLTNHPKTFLQMPHKMELAVTDETDVEGLEQSETRDKIKTSFVIRCERAFVPYDVIEVPAVSIIVFESKINDILTGGQKTEEILSWYAGLMENINLEITAKDVEVSVA